MLLVFAMREIQAHSVHAGVQQSANGFQIVGSGTKGANYLCVSHGPSFGHSGAERENLPVMATEQTGPVAAGVKPRGFFSQYRIFSVPDLFQFGSGR
jgi:hypothetical protein